MKKESRRVKMTKMLLNESFLKFLAQKPLTRITIKEICEEADVNRSTYYAHFTDPYDQLKKLEADIMTDMSAFVDSLLEGETRSEKNQRQKVRAILEYIQSRRNVFQVLLGKSGDLDLQRDILTFFGERIFEPDQAADSVSLERAYKYIYTSTGSFGIIYHWIKDDTAVSIDQITDWIVSLNTPHQKN